MKSLSFDLHKVHTLNKKLIFSLICSLTIISCTPADLTPDAQSQVQTHAQPNVLLILTDDQGYGDLGFNGNQIIETPNLDQLFEQGVSFDRYYVSPVCAPTRASILTGKHYLSTGVFHVTRGGEKMHPENTTLAELLKPEGYRTGLFGKWHNGLQYPHDPIGQGFDEFYGFSAGHLSEYFDNYLHQSDASNAHERVKYKGYVADAITDKVIEFVSKESQAPFFAMLSFNSPHGPFQSPDALFKKYKDKQINDVDASIYAMVENIDKNVKRTLDTLKQRGVLDNTIVLFMSDNGPAFPNGQSRYNAGLTGHKGLVDEGGVRSPLVISWPNKTMSTRRVMPITQHIDIVPTLLSFLDIDYEPEDFDGKDLSPLLFDQNKRWNERALYTHRFQISENSSTDPIHPIPGAIRTQKFTALVGEDGIWKLYDLEQDPEQSVDVSETFPEILADYQAKYASWYEQITSEHGPYVTLPIELGHEGHSQVRLPAHESLILGKLSYAHGAGWSHDWLVPDTQETGSAYWPLKVVSAGRYKLVVDYATDNGADYNGELTAQIGDARLVKTELKGFKGEELSGPRQYFTDEAPDLTWAQQSMGEFELTVGKQDLTLMFTKDKDNHALWIKQATLIKL
jgi:arylsulfatase A